MSDLKKIFGYILSSKELEDSLMDVAQVISEKGSKATRTDCLKALSIYGIKEMASFKKGSLRLLLFYLKVVLKDNLISAEELNNIRYLKLLFGVKEGDYTKEKVFAAEISNLIKLQIDLIYKDDEVSSEEAIHKVNLQEAFGLNYDEFLSQSSKAALDSLDRTDDWIKIDTYITVNNYRKWEKEKGYSTYLKSSEDSSTNRHISQSVKDDVWNRDGGVCVQCGSNQNIEFDHIIPHSKGGSNTYRNIQLLCEPCNRTKSDKIG